jgi:hypothetical protein
LQFANTLTATTLADDRSDIGVSVRLWADTEVQKGHTYQLMYQLRIHTQTGELGPILGTSDRPTGITYSVASATADTRWNGLEGVADITRKDLTGMTHLPSGEMVTIRVEPHLYDQTAAKFVTPGKTRAIIVIATVHKSGRVESVLSLRAWIAANARDHADKVLTTLAGLDEYDLEGNGIGEAIGGVLNVKDLPTPTKVRFIRAVPKQVVHPKTPDLWRTLNVFAASDDADLRAAAQAALEAAK